MNQHQQNTGGISVPMNAILHQLHDRYGKLVAQLMQENAELQAAVDTQGGELDDYRSRALAQARDHRPAAPSSPFFAVPDHQGEADPGSSLGGMAPRPIADNPQA